SARYRWRPALPPHTARSVCARPATFPWAATWWPAAGGSQDPQRERLRFESPSENTTGPRAQGRPTGRRGGQTGYSHPIPKAGIGGSPRFAGQAYRFPWGKPGTAIQFQRRELVAV